MQYECSYRRIAHHATEPLQQVSKQVRTEAVLGVAVQSISGATNTLGAECTTLAVVCTAEPLVTPVASRCIPTAHAAQRSRWEKSMIYGGFCQKYHVSQRWSKEGTVKARKLAYYGYAMRKQGSCLEKEIVQGTMPDARRQGRPRTAWMDNIRTRTGLSVEESIRLAEDRDKWRKCGQPSDRGRLKTEQDHVSHQKFRRRLSAYFKLF